LLTFLGRSALVHVIDAEEVLRPTAKLLAHIGLLPTKLLLMLVHYDSFELFNLELLTDQLVVCKCFVYFENELVVAALHVLEQLTTFFYVLSNC